MIFFMRPEGIEPPPQAPEAYVLSIGPRAQGNAAIIQIAGSLRNCRQPAAGAPRRRYAGPAGGGQRNAARDAQRVWDGGARAVYKRSLIVVAWEREGVA